MRVEEEEDVVVAESVDPPYPSFLPAWRVRPRSSSARELSDTLENTYTLDGTHSFRGGKSVVQPRIDENLRGRGNK